MLAETVADTDGQTLGILKYKMVSTSNTVWDSVWHFEGNTR